MGIRPGKVSSRATRQLNRHPGNDLQFGIPPPEVLGVGSIQYRQIFNETVKGFKPLAPSSHPMTGHRFERLGTCYTTAYSYSSGSQAFLTISWTEIALTCNLPLLTFSIEQSHGNTSAVQAFGDLQAKALYTRQATSQYASSDRPGVDVIVVPTTPLHPTIEEVLADPIKLNSKLGTFTHFGNVLDLCRVAAPAAPCTTEDGTTLPFGVTFLSARCTDAEVLRIWSHFENAL